MKRYKFVVAATCLLLSAVGFLGLYATNQPEEKKNEQAKNQQIVEESEKIILGSNEFELDESEQSDFKDENQLAEMEQDVNIETESQEVAEAEPESEDQEATVGTITPEVLHFSPENGLKWPVDGNVLLDYSMDATIFFPTLQQYQYNPAMVLAAKVNDKVYFAAKGKVVDISTNEETGCTVTQDIGDGYTVVYGQLKELNFDLSVAKRDEPSKMVVLQDKKGKDKMKNPEKNAVAKLGYTVTMVVVTTAILICMKKYKID